MVKARETQHRDQVRGDHIHAAAIAPGGASGSH